MKAGFAERDITPDVGMQMPGNYLPDFVKGFHDECKVRAAVFDDGAMRVALVGADSVVVPQDVVEAARKQIQARCGIAPDAVMVGAAHDHSAGPIGMVEAGEFAHASELVRHLAYEKSQVAESRLCQMGHRADRQCSLRGEPKTGWMHTAGRRRASKTR